MKKFIAIITVIAIVAIGGASYADTPLKKLGRGIANVITCPLEIIKGVTDANSESGPVAAMTFGVIKGLFNTGVRAVVGAYEVTTFIIPIPAGYGPILRNPEFFFEEGIF